ncbi:MAG: NUDIX hydrolase [Rhodoluna sp.]|jgi:8-oxo-dGTP pyrophosphatase MutT (NUDIX family)/phosphohistidine phosphatase SixA
MAIVAAGAILWRKVDGDLKVLVIHRDRYDDWSWPKGKLDKHEHVNVAAIREIKEETGLKVHLGVKLAVVEYRVDKVKKYVHYWAAEVTDAMLQAQKFVPDEEVGSLDWFSVKEAKKKLTYKHDLEPLEKLVELDQAGQLKTRAMIILRHAKATPRDQWAKGETTRPLLPIGAVQATALTKVLASFGPKLVVSSRWKRCVDTVTPFVAKYRVRLVERSQLSELGAKNGPRRTQKLVHKLIGGEKSFVICSHRPAFPTIVEAISHYADKHKRKELAEVTSLKPGDFYVIHIAFQAAKSKHRIVSIDLVEQLNRD